MPHGADALGEIGDGADLVAVPIHHRGVNLKRQSCPLAAFDARYRKLVGMLQPAEAIVLGGIQTVHTDAHGTRAGLLETHRNIVGQKGAVGAEHGTQPSAGSMLHQLEDVGAQKRLSPAEDHDLEPRDRNLVDEHLAFFSGKLPPAPHIGILIAVRAA